MIVAWIVATSLLWATACTPPEGDAPAPRFVALGDAVARDARTGLEWSRRDGGALAWHAAETHCRSLAVDDAGGWRLPAIEELRGLYDEGARVPCGDATCAIAPVFALTTPYVWSATAEQGPNARTYLDFRFGTELTPSIGPRLVRSVLCVRRPPR
jgi:hypothetical protein